MTYLQKKKQALLNYVSGITPPLPSEYQEVEWVGSDTGRNAIDLITEQSSVDYEYMVEFEITSLINNYNAVITHYSGGNGTGFRINKSTNKLRLGYKTGNWTDVGNALSLNTKYKVEFDKNGVSINGDFISAIPTGTDNARITFLSFANGANYGFAGHIYSAQIKGNGQLVRNLIPCYRKADNVIGFYDTIQEEFLTDLNNRPLIKGADI